MSGRYFHGYDEFAGGAVMAVFSFGVFCAIGFKYFIALSILFLFIKLVMYIYLKNEINTDEILKGVDMAKKQGITEISINGKIFKIEEIEKEFKKRLT